MDDNDSQNAWADTSHQPDTHQQDPRNNSNSSQRLSPTPTSFLPPDTTPAPTLVPPVPNDNVWALVTPNLGSLVDTQPSELDTETQPPEHDTEMDNEDENIITESLLHTEGKFPHAEKHYLHDTQAEPAAKRYAISGPSRGAFSLLREREAITRKMVLHKSVIINQQSAQIRSLKDKLLSGKETENQMAEQILQFEVQIQTLMTENKSYAKLIEEQKMAMDADRTLLQNLHKSNKEMMRTLNDMRAQNEQQTAAHIDVVNRIWADQEREKEKYTETLNMLRAYKERERQIVKETMRQMNVSYVTVSPASKQPSSTRTRNRKILETQKQQMSHTHDLLWKELVRTSWKTTFNVNSIANFAQYDPAPARVVEAFETGQDGPDESNTLDFNKGFKKSRWNQVILQRLYNKILVDREIDGTWNVPHVPEEYLTALLYGQLKRSREAWSLVQQCPDFANKRMETRDDVMACVAEYTNDRITAVTLQSRREQKYQHRVKTVARVITLKTESEAPDLAAWLHFRDLLSQLSANGMSSEEDCVAKIGDITVPVFRMKLCVWRNTLISDYFKYIDKESQSLTVRGKQGSRLQPRVYTDEYGNTGAPTGLPQSIYDAGWLEEQEALRSGEWVTHEMRVSQEAFEMLEFAATV